MGVRSASSAARDQADIRQFSSGPLKSRDQSQCDSVDSVNVSAQDAILDFNNQWESTRMEVWIASIKLISASAKIRKGKAVAGKLPAIEFTRMNASSEVALVFYGPTSKIQRT